MDGTSCQYYKGMLMPDSKILLLDVLSCRRLNQPPSSPTWSWHIPVSVEIIFYSKDPTLSHLKCANPSHTALSPMFDHFNCSDAYIAAQPPYQDWEITSQTVLQICSRRDLLLAGSTLNTPHQSIFLQRRLINGNWSIVLKFQTKIMSRAFTHFSRLWTTNY